MVMSTQAQGELTANSTQTLELKSLYQIPGFQFVFPEPPLRGVFDIVDVQERDGIQQDVLVVNVNYKGEIKEVSLMGGKGFVNNPKKITINNLDFYLSYGSDEVEIPFSIRLNDFIAEKYPGTESSYSSFMLSLIHI